MAILIMVGVALMLIGFFSLCVYDGTTFAGISLFGGIMISILSGLFCILNGGGL